MSEENESLEGAKNLTLNTAIVYDGDTPTNISDDMEKSYLEYSMAVIVSRALPDVRDWMKPVHRRILYSMHEQGLKSTAKYRKCATVVWNVLWKYHPHGDSSVYGALVRMAQDFSLRYPLIDWQGNFGSIDGDNPAAYRYTESKLEKVTELILADIEKDTVDFRDNFDATQREPSVLPTRLPSLLMNGVMGIAVWMATNIPSHNLGELIGAIKYIMKSENPEEITVEDLMQFVQGPDFCTGWEVYDREAILTAYSTWRGSVIMRWIAKIEENNKWRAIINISEIPYNVNKSNLVAKIGELVRDKKIVWISALRDESNKNWIRIIVEIKKDAFPKKILNQIFKLTQLQTSFGYNMIGLWERGKQPKLYNLKDLLTEFITHRQEVVTRRTQFELRKAEARAHILEGLKKALDHIDEVIKTIRASKTKEEANIALMKQFGFSEIQATAILEMRLNKLAGLERQKIEDELNEKLILIADLLDILSKPERINSIIDTEFDEALEVFGDERRTKVNAGKVWEFNPKDTIPNEEVMIAFSKKSYIKRVKSNAFRTQRRGGKWIATGTKEDDEIMLMVPTMNHSDLLFFTTKWRVFNLPAYEIPETSRTAKWQPVINLLNLQKGEEIAAILDITRAENKFLFFVSKNWIVKKLDMEEVRKIRSNWLKVVWVKEWDDLMWVKTTSWNDNIFLATHNWKAIQFNEDNVRPMWRWAAWVKWINLKSGDEVIEVAIVSEEVKYVFTVTETWMWKITGIEEYKNQKRWWTWVKAMIINAKTWKLVSCKILSEEDKKTLEVILISKWGQTIRMNLGWIRKTSRVTQWVILTKLKQKNDIVVRASLIKQWEEEEANA